MPRDSEDRHGDHRHHHHRSRRRSSIGNDSSSRPHRRRSSGKPEDVEADEDGHRRDRHRRRRTEEKRKKKKKERRYSRRDSGESRRKKGHRGGGGKHHHRGSQPSLSSEDDCSLSSSVSSLSDHYNHRHKNKSREGIRKEDEGSIDSAYIYCVDADVDEKEGEKTDDEGRRHRDHQLAAGKDVAQEIIERRHLELELTEVREQLATAVADTMRLERKAERLESATKFLYRENQELKKKLADQSMDRTPSSAREGDGHQGKDQVLSSSKQPRRRSFVAGCANASVNDTSISTLDVLRHTTQETKMQLSSTGSGTCMEGGKLGEWQGSSTRTFQEIPLSVLKAPPPHCEAPPSGGRKNQARLLSRGASSSRSSVNKNSSSKLLQQLPPPVADITVEKKSTAVERSTSERLRLENGLPHIGTCKREENALSKRAHAMQRAVSERVFRSPGGTDKA